MKDYASLKKYDKMFHVSFLKISSYWSTPKNPYVTSLLLPRWFLSTPLSSKSPIVARIWWWRYCILTGLATQSHQATSCLCNCEAKIGGSGLWAVKIIPQSAIFTRDKRCWYIKLNISATRGPIWPPIKASCSWLPRARSNIHFGCPGRVKQSRCLTKGYYSFPCFC